MTTTFRLGEFFSGPGGIALGAKLARVTAPNGEALQFEHVWATDYDQDTCDTYAHNICPDTPDVVVCENIKRLDLRRLQDISAIDAFAFGFPCNDYSVVGEQKGMDGHFGPLYLHGVQAIKLFRPKFFLAENVGGLRNANEGKTFERILSDLYDCGYSVYPHLYRFDEYGVPQARQRVIIIGIRHDMDVIYKIPSTAPYKEIDVSSRTAIECPPIAPNVANQELTAQSKLVVERLQHIKPGENAFNANLPEHLTLNVKGAKISQIYKRLNPAKPAYTVTGSGGGGTHMYHWSEPRALTNRERARLQTFPDDFIFFGAKDSVRKQIGMAVPCLGAKVIFEAVLKCFAGIDYPETKPNLASRIQPEHADIINGRQRVSA